MGFEFSAATVSIEYADLLLVTASGQLASFKEWQIGSIEKDIFTAEVCAALGLIFVATPETDEGETDMRFHKARTINALLEKTAAGWLLLLDADIILPADFRERLEGQGLEAGCLYGVAGRKIVLTPQELERALAHEPWEAHCERTTGIWGYFQLFHNGTEPNRYPVIEGPRSEKVHDDTAFALSFAEQKRKHLPFTVLHLGPTVVNWLGRKSRKWGMGDLPADFPKVRMPEPWPGPKRVAWLGAYPKKQIPEAVTGAGEAIWLDHWRLAVPSGDELVAADRKWLRGKLGRVMSTAGNAAKAIDEAGVAEKLMVHGTGGGIGEVDAVYFDVEAGYSWLGDCMPHWLRRLSPEGKLGGSQYGRRFWPDGTLAVALAAGPPDATDDDGRWWLGVPQEKREWNGEFPISLPLCASPEDVDAAWETERKDRLKGCGVLVVTPERGRADATVVTLHSLRHHWKGPVTVILLGREIPALRVGCQRYGVHYFRMQPDGGNEEALAAALASSPFEKTLYLAPGTLVCAQIDGMFAGMDEVVVTASAPVGSGAMCFGMGWDEFGEGADGGFWNAGKEAAGDGAGGHAEEFAPKRHRIQGVHAAEDPMRVESQPQLVVYGPDESRWQQRWWAARREAEDATIRALACPVRCGEDLSIVIPVAAADVTRFWRNWQAWSFPKRVPVIVVLQNLPRTVFAGLSGADAVKFVELESPWSVAPDLDILQAVVPHLHTSAFVWLEPNCLPAAGAEMFLSPEWASFAVVRHHRGKSVDAESGDRPLLRGGMSLLNTAFAKILAENASETADLDTQAWMLCEQRGLRAGAFWMADWGWQNSGNPV